MRVVVHVPLLKVSVVMASEMTGLLLSASACDIVLLASVAFCNKAGFPTSLLLLAWLFDYHSTGSSAAAVAVTAAVLLLLLTWHW